MKRILLLVAILGTAACSSSATSGDPGTSLSAAQTRWAAWGDDYRFDFDRSCFCPESVVEPVTIEVRDGRIASVVSRNTGQPVATVEGAEWLTIDDLFRVIEEAEAEGQAIQVEYAREGYPSRIEIGQIAADAGILYFVANVQRL